MRNKTIVLDLPLVNKPSTRMTKNKSKTTINLNFGANCSAIKIHDHEPRHSHSKRSVKSSKIKSVYIPQSSRSNHHRTSSASKLGRISVVSDVNCSLHPPSPKSSYSRSSVASDMYIKKITKIYQSQSQSGTVVVCGVEVPCAPPATPTPEQLRYHQYIPSLNDVMAQRAVKGRLEKMEKKEMKKQERKREEELKQEKLNQRDKLSEKRRMQRLEIYALNKVMTDLENKKFQEFCEAKGIS